MIRLLTRTSLSDLRSSASSLNFTQVRTSFYNKYKHGPIAILNPKPDYVQWFKDIVFGNDGKEFLLVEAPRIIRNNCNFQSEWPKVRPKNKTKVFEHFDSDESIKRWKPVADSDSSNGFSLSTIVRSPAGHALFKGVVDNRLPDDGLTMRSGCAGIIGPGAERTKLFQIQSFWDWTNYNCFEIRFRGDGRKYNIILNTASYTDDQSYYDVYGYPLYTRGGPYWQTVRIPFNKFIFVNNSFVQDNQGSLPTHAIKFVAFTITDTYDGPFELEIDYLGLRDEDILFFEKSPYEMYAFPHIKYRPLQVSCDPPERAVA